MKIILRPQSGFTLIELMVVVGIIGVLSSIAQTQFKVFSAKATQSEAQLQLSHIYTLQQTYFADNSRYFNPGNDYGEKSRCDVKSAQNSWRSVGLDSSPETCRKLRYKYGFLVPSFQKPNFTVQAIARKIFSGCNKSDVWIMDQDKSIGHPIDAVKLCD